MGREGGFTFPNSGNKVVQSLKARVFTRDVTHDTPLLNIKVMVKIFRGDRTRFGSVKKGEVTKLSTSVRVSIRREKIPPLAIIQRRRGTLWYRVTWIHTSTWSTEIRHMCGGRRRGRVRRYITFILREGEIQLFLF
jgi:hypothetical protein